MSVHAAIFDLDGTLLDTLADLGNSVNRILSIHGFPGHDIACYRKFVGHGARILVTRALPDGQQNEDIIQACFEEFQKDYSQNWKVASKLYEGIPKMLDALSAQKIKLAVLSNKPHEFTKLCADKYLNRWPFDVVAGQQDGIPQKPDPAGAFAIAKQLGLSPGSCMFIGDSGVDMQTAAAAGMIPVGVTWGFRSTQELKENGAEYLLSQPLEILDFLSF